MIVLNKNIGKCWRPPVTLYDIMFDSTTGKILPQFDVRPTSEIHDFRAWVTFCLGSKT